jgi:hypothetical protein
VLSLYAVLRKGKNPERGPFCIGTLQGINCRPLTVDKAREHGTPRCRFLTIPLTVNSNNDVLICSENVTLVLC